MTPREIRADEHDELGLLEIGVVVRHRIGTERALQDPEGVYIRFYGSSFIADSTGAKVAEADEVSEATLTAKFDLAANEELRNNWFVFRDRRPELYGALTSYDGTRR